MNKKFFIIAIILLFLILVTWFFYKKSAETKDLVSPLNLNEGIINENNYLEAASSTADIENIVSQYLKKNIAALSADAPVLGGKWYTTKIDFLQGNKGRVYYEDGHIAREASFSYVVDGESVAIFNFYINATEPTEPEESKIIKDLENILEPEEIADQELVPGATTSSESAVGENLLPEEIIACTMDAMMCPDGSYVGRIAPECEFSPCP